MAQLPGIGFWDAVLLALIGALSIFNLTAAQRYERWRPAIPGRPRGSSRVWMHLILGVYAVFLFALSLRFPLFQGAHLLLLPPLVGFAWGMLNVGMWEGIDSADFQAHQLGIYRAMSPASRRRFLWGVPLIQLSLALPCLAIASSAPPGQYAAIWLAAGFFKMSVTTWNGHRQWLATMAQLAERHEGLPTYFKPATPMDTMDKMD